MNDSDSTILNLLREHDALTISDLVEHLGVTATAVRQKLDRLTAAGLVQRHRQFATDEHDHHTRGRPHYRYELTDAGRRQLGNNFGDLAVALWEEVRRIDDPDIRSAVLGGVLQKLEQRYGEQISGDTLQQRLESLAEFFAQRQIPVDVGIDHGLPVLNIHGCPYPDLAQHDRTICEWETELLSKLIGHPVRLERCQDHGCCTFQADPNRAEESRATA